MSYDRMPGRYGRVWCPSCCGPAGPDCPDRSRSGHQVRQQLKRQLDADSVSALAERARPYDQDTGRDSRA